MCCKRWTSTVNRSLGDRLVFATVALLLATSALKAEALVFHASESGKQTLDQGEGGGNPFASALIELLQRPSLTLSHLPAALQQLTERKSRGFQSADVPGSVHQGNFSLVPPKSGERRIALVIVVSDYTQSGGAQSLPGAKHDAQRVASALRMAGFNTEIALDLDLRAMKEKLADFGKRTVKYDTAAIYTTGHGVEVGGAIFLLPGDYPIKQRGAALPFRALALSEIARSLAARQANLVFYGGCRDNPFAQ